MDPMEITDERSLTAWLSDKPADWAQAIALRAALRVLPLTANASVSWLKSFALLPFSAVLTSWAQLKDNSIDVLLDTGRANARFGGELFDFESYRNEDIASAAADASYHSADAQSGSMWVASDCAKAVGMAAEAFHSASVLNGVPNESGDSPAESFWQSVQIDCISLADHPSATAAKSLAVQPVWDQSSVGLDDHSLQLLAQRLLSIDPNYAVWINWLERRNRGNRAAFRIRGDKYSIEDKKILRRLAEATDEDFWGKGHEYVNATLKGWLDEARERVAPPMKTVAETPPQNRNAISFRTDEDGRITIDASALVDQLRTDTEARDRHSEATSEAQAVLDRCRGNNAAARLTLRLENYLAAIGASIEGAKPSLLVQRGEKLRQELAAYAVPDTLLDPIADDILVDLRGWQSSHNMMVGLDPVLMAIDTATLGPDRRPALISPDEIKRFVHDAVEADLLAEGTEDILVEAADLAPAIPDPNDRRTTASIEMVRNLCIEAVSIVLNNPKISVAAITVSLAASSNAVAATIGGISIMSSIKAAEYLVAHRQWIEDRMGNTPTWQTLFLRVADWLEKYTPFKPK
jgi:hypothetical protein